MNSANFTAGAILFLLAGCAAPPVPPTPAADCPDPAAAPAAGVTVAAPSAVVGNPAGRELGWLREAQRIGAMDAQTYRQELEQRRRAHGQRPDLDNTLRLAVLLSRPQASDDELARARTLVGAALGAALGATPAEREVAAYLLAEWEARARLREQRRRLQQELEQERAARLRIERQLEALKAIEMSWERSGGAPVAGGADGGTASHPAGR